MKTIILKTYGDTSDVEALTDAYSDDYGGLFMLSLFGNDSVVKAMSGHILDGNGKKSRNRWSYNGLYVMSGDEDQNHFVHAHPRQHYRVITQKIQTGLTHQLIIDPRFFEATEKEPTRLVYVRPGEDPAAVLWEVILKHVASPMLPEWTEAVYQVLLNNRRRYDGEKDGYAREYDAYPEGSRVLMVSLDEEQLDAIISSLVQGGSLKWN